jgi:hypothetical protein
MNRSLHLFLAIAATTLFATAAFADMASEVSGARAEASIAANSDDMESLKMHLSRASNCMVGPESGYYYAPPGNPCAGQGKGAVADSNLYLQKKRLGDAALALGAAGNQSALEDAHRYANQAIQLLDSAMKTSE